MERSAVLERLGVGSDDPLAERLYAATEAASAPADWRALAAGLARVLMPSAARAGTPAAAPGPLPRWSEVAGPLLLGLSGAQGSGKSTLARALSVALAAAGARSAVLSLDDFYRTRTERRALAARVHPLLATRGVPGTHDVGLLLDVLDSLGEPGTVAVPRFDKGIDDRRPPDQWDRVGAPVDVVVLEGWCVGAQPEPPAALAAPVNELEATEDPDGVWRQHVNDALGAGYRRVWARLHALVYLQAPDLAAVLRWRGEQETALPPARRMNGQALARFVAHYERVTRAGFATLPARADLLVRLGHDHRVVDVALRRQAASSSG